MKLATAAVLVFVALATQVSVNECFLPRIVVIKKKPFLFPTVVAIGGKKKPVPVFVPVFLKPKSAVAFGAGAALGSGAGFAVGKVQGVGLGALLTKVKQALPRVEVNVVKSVSSQPAVQYEKSYEQRTYEPQQPYQASQQSSQKYEPSRPKKKAPEKSAGITISFGSDD